MNLKKYVKEWFNLSSRERTGVLVLLVLIVCALTVNLFLRYYPCQQKRYDHASYHRELELFRSAIRNPGGNPEDSPEEMDKPVFQLFPFDPNTATRNEMIKLGMEERIASRIISYREKGGRFYRKEDLLKIYGFEKILFASLAPYINILKDEVPVPKMHMPEEEFLHAHPVEINSSDTSDLEGLKGIGPVLASRIVKYRILLGGYYSVDQLKEVYGISDSLFQTIKNYVTVDTALISKISINEAGEERLSRHPYFGRYRAKAIVTYRRSNGSISSIEELVKNRIIPAERIDKIKAYLLFP